MTIPVWIIDDEKVIRDSLGQTLEIEGYNVATYSTATEALGKLDASFEGIIISDINMPLMDGITFLNRALVLDKEIVVIMLTGHGDISTAVGAMRAGAYDFLEKPFSTDHLLDTVKRGLDKRGLVLENRDLRRELETQSNPGPRILGNHQAIKQIRRTLAHIKDQHSDVLLHGETGTGKELAARFLHDHGAAQDTPFVAMKCRQIPEMLLESELFGNPHTALPAHAFHKQSKMAAAENGTLFIDGIEATPQSLQIRLSRLMEDNDPGRPRIIASSRYDLKTMTEQGGFDRQLYSRLSTISLYLPPLRERKTDIQTLCQNFFRTTASRYGLEAPCLTDVQKKMFQAHNWPGNVRELRNVAERILLLGENEPNLLSDPDTHMTPASLNERLMQFELSLLSDALKRHNGRLKEVQQELGLARKTLYEKLKKHNLDKDSFKS